MRSELSRDRLRSTAVARGRMFLKSRLAWLPGYPIGQVHYPEHSRQCQGGVDWQPLGKLASQLQPSICLGPQHLQDATYTWTKLVHSFPRALPYLFADDKRWRQGVPQLLDLLKNAIHHAKPLPRSLLGVPGVYSRNVIERAHVLAERNPSIVPVLDALTWNCFLNPDALEENLKWAESRSFELTLLLTHTKQGVALNTALLLAEIARQDGRRRSDPLLEILADPRSHKVATELPPTYLDQWSKRFARHAKGKASLDGPGAIKPDIAAQSLAFLQWATQQSDPTRRRALDMFALLSPQPSLDSWEEWWRETNRLLERAEGLMQSASGKSVRDSLKAIIDSVTERGRHRPASCAPAKILANVQSAAAPQRSALYPQLLELLRQLPHTQGASSTRAAFLAHWLNLYESHGDRAVALLRDVRVFLKTFPDALSESALWQPLVEHWDKHQSPWCYTFDGEILNDLRQRNAWSALFHALRHCVGQRMTLAESDGERLIELSKVTDDGALACAYLRELIGSNFSGGYFNEPLFRSAHVLDAHSGQFLRLLEALSGVVEEDRDAGEALVALARRFLEAGWSTLARDLVLSGEVRVLLLTHEREATLRSLGAAAPPPPTQREVYFPEWMQRYPPELRRILAMLAGLTADAQALASRVLAKRFPDPGGLAQEISTMEKHLARSPHDERLARRLANRRRELHEPAPISAAQLAKFEKKLLHVVHLRALRTWDEQLTQDLATRLRERLAVEQLPDWLLQQRQLRLIRAITALPPAFRSLAWRLLSVRCGPPPWRLADEPPNQEFIGRLKAFGIDPDPWINPPVAKRYEAPNGAALWLAFEQDPLEIFQMGSHFGTCLSPGDANFFSVFANAADINKHVVYARDREGRILGRCLIALTDRGGLLTFEAYCHDRKLGFAGMMASLAAQLASDMKTVVVPHGNVPRLVAPAWYDDGPRDLCNRFGFLKGASPLQQSLKTIKLDEVVAALEGAFAPIALNSFSLPLILEMEVMDERPQLVIPLLPYVEACKGLVERAWLRAAALAFRTEERGFAYRVLHKQAAQYLLRHYRRLGRLDSEVLLTLVEYDPSAALQVLRRTRSRGVRDDTQETDFFRIQALASAHARLNRPLVADALRKCV